MHGIVALLDDEHTAKVEALWKDLRKNCGLSGILIARFPHFSWHVAEDYEFEPFEEKLAQITHQIAPFTVHTAGLGVFSGENPVVYIQIVKDPQLLHLHQNIWEETQGFGTGVSQYYAPERWIPHITLASRDVTKDNLPHIVSLLWGRLIDWEIQIDCFALGYQHADSPGKITKTFPLNSQG
jgi:2'-5' RNA ligase